MVKRVPSLSPEGFVGAVTDKLSRATMYFYLSEYSQSFLYRGAIRPLAWLVQQHGSDPAALRTEVETYLQVYYSRLFDAATVSVSSDIEDNIINLQLSVIVQDAGTQYGLGHVIRTSNAKVLDIFDINNDGYVLPNHGNTIIS